MSEKQIVNMQNVVSLLKPNMVVYEAGSSQNYTVYEMEPKQDGETYSYYFLVNGGNIFQSKPAQYDWDDPILQRQLFRLMSECENQGMSLAAIVVAGIYSNMVVANKEGSIDKLDGQKFSEYDMNNLENASIKNEPPLNSLFPVTEYFIKFIIQDNKTGVIKSTPNYVHLVRGINFDHSMGILHYLGYRKKEHFLKMLAQTQKMHQK